MRGVYCFAFGLYGIRTLYTNRAVHRPWGFPPALLYQKFKILCKFLLLFVAFSYITKKQFRVFLQFKTYNPAFTQIEIWFRFIYLLFTFGVTVSDAWTLRIDPSFITSNQLSPFSSGLPIVYVSFLHSTGPLSRNGCRCSFRCFSYTTVW